MKFTYYGQACFSIEIAGKRLLFDPFITGNPLVKDIDINTIQADYILVSHGHEDHVGDSVEIAKKNSSTIIAINELANHMASLGCKAHNMGIGGSKEFPFGKVKFTIAHHSSSLGGVYMGEPAGILLNIEGKTIYHSGDTGLFLDMKLIGEMNSIDAALLPIGENFTMGVDDAVKAVEFLNCKLAIPMHYSTFPVVNADPEEFRRKVESIGRKCTVIPFGGSIEI